MLLKNKPKVSIILTAYNGEKYIKDQIDSILSQQFTDWELIICEDCSNDKTLEIAQKYERENNNIIIIKNKINLGLTKNFESGLNTARGEFIAVCDIDDYWMPDKLKLQVELLEADKNIGLVYHDVYITDENLNIKKESSLRKILKGNILSAHRTNIQEDNLKSLIIENHITAPTIMFRSQLTEKIVPFPEKTLQDIWMGLIAATFSNIGYIDKQLIKYRQHANNMVGAKMRGYKFYLNNLFQKKFLAYYDEDLNNYANRLIILQKRAKEANKLNGITIMQEKINYLENIIKFLNSSSFTQYIHQFYNCIKIINNSRTTNNFNILIYLLIYKLNPFKF